MQALEHNTKHLAEKFVEAMQSQPPEKTVENSSRNVVKEAAAKRLLNNKKGKAVLMVKKKIVKKIVKKNRGVSPIINECNRNGEEIRSAEQEDKKETETLVEASNKIQSKSSEQETGKEAEIQVESSVQAKAKASNRITPNSIRSQTKLMKKILPMTADGKDAPNKFQNKIVKKNKGMPLVINERSDINHSEIMQSKEANAKKEKTDHEGEQQKKNSKEDREKTGGLIFLCSAKTKPDCFKYCIMAVPESQKDMILGIKPGLKLFLYDYDLKLMYGIYKASSSGGKKLEPKAFGGAFPYQVRFRTHADCFPLPESILKKEMPENYVTKHKLKTELTFKQVIRLMELFRPVVTRPMAQPQVNNLPASSTRKERVKGRGSHLNVRKSHHHSEMEMYPDDHYAGRDERRYPPPLAHERDWLISNREVREEPTREMFLTEKEYRSYGLRGERRISDIPSPCAAPASDLYWEDYHRRRHREYDYAGSSSSDHRRVYSFDSRRENPLADRYPDYQRRVNIPSSEASWMDSDHDLQRREIDPVDRIYGLWQHRQMEYDLRRYGRGDPNQTSMPVSSRYSFAGPR